jgi:glycine hydroxymethyltransferase
MFKKSMTIAGFDDELFKAMEQERQRQEDHIELIARKLYQPACYGGSRIFINK